MAGHTAGFGKLAIDESKVYVVRTKADGRRYKIFHDGTEQLVTDAEEREAAEHAARQQQAKES